MEPRTLEQSPIEAPPPAYDPTPDVKVAFPASSSSAHAIPMAAQSPEPAPTPAADATASEADWQAKLSTLERRLTQYNNKPPRAHSRSRSQEEPGILASMRDLSASHPDPVVQQYWTRNADDFENAADEKSKRKLLKEMGKAVGVLIAAPFAITGIILVETGQLLKTSGDWISGGAFSSVRRKKQKVRDQSPILL